MKPNFVPCWMLLFQVVNYIQCVPMSRTETSKSLTESDNSTQEQKHYRVRRHFNNERIANSYVDMTQNDWALSDPIINSNQERLSMHPPSYNRASLESIDKEGSVRNPFPVHHGYAIPRTMDAGPLNLLGEGTNKYSPTTEFAESSTGYNDFIDHTYKGVVLNPALKKIWTIQADPNFLRYDGVQSISMENQSPESEIEGMNSHRFNRINTHDLNEFFTHPQYPATFSDQSFEHPEARYNDYLSDQKYREATAAIKRVLVESPRLLDDDDSKLYAQVKALQGAQLLSG